MLQQAAAAVFNTLGKSLYTTAQREMFDDIHRLPEPIVRRMVVFGSGAMSGVVAQRAASLASTWGYNQVFFTGGLEPTKSPFAKMLLPKLAKVGHAMPEAGEKEADYMKRVFEAAMASKTEGSFLNSKEARLVVDNTSRNTGENCRNLNKLGAGEGDEPTMIITLPYHALRTLGTWRKEVSENQPIRPVMAWPTEELGIAPNNWRKSPLALYIVQDEAKKISGNKPSYVMKGFCTRPDMKAEHRKLMGVLNKEQEALRPYGPWEQIFSILGGAAP